MKSKKTPGIATYVIDFVRDADAMQKPFVISGILNREYLRGNQYKKVSKRLGIVDKKTPGTLYTEKKTFNRMLPIYTTRYGILAGNMPIVGFKPIGNKGSSVRGAVEGNQFIEDFSRSVNLEKKYSRLIQLADVDPIAWVKTGIDWSKGDLVGTIPTTVSNDGNSTKGEINIHEGRCFIDVVPMHEVFIRNLKVDGMDEVAELVHRRVMSCDYIQARFGFRPLPEDKATFDTYPYYNDMSFGISQGSASEVASVYEYYKKADALYPKGRYVMVVGETVVYDNVLPFINGKDGERDIPFQYVNLQTIPGHIMGSSIYTQLIPIQDTYNSVKNRLLEYINHLSIGQMFVRQGALVNGNSSIVNKPGKAIMLKRNAKTPEVVRKERIGNEFTQYLTGLEQDMLITAGLSAMQAFGLSKSNMRTDGVVDKISDADSNKLTNAVKNLGNVFISAFEQIIYMEQSRYDVLVNTYKLALTPDDMLKYKVRKVDPTKLTVVNSEFLMNSDVVLDKKMQQAMALGVYNPQAGFSYRTKAEMLDAINSGYLKETLDPTERANYELVALEHEHLHQDMEIVVEAFHDHKLHKIEHNLKRLSSEFLQLKQTDPERFNELNKKLDAHIKQHETYDSKSNSQAHNAKAFM